jgi:hypothetical protein
MSSSNQTSANQRKNSTYNATTGRYVLGGRTEVSSWALEWWNRVTPVTDPSDIVYYVEKAYEGLPRKLGTLFYGNEEFWWIICQYNGIIDPIGELVQGRRLLIPLLDRAKKQFLVYDQQVGGIASTRGS